MIKGYAISGGKAVGYPLCLKRIRPSITAQTIDDVDKAIETLVRALHDAARALKHIQKALPVNTVAHAVIDTHIEMVNDQEIYKATVKQIRENLYDPAYAYKTVIKQYSERLGALDDPYFRGRAADIEDVFVRVVSMMQDKKRELPTLTKPTILVADTLEPSAFLSLNRTHIIGLVLEIAAPTDHVVMLAKEYNIPTLINATGACDIVKEKRRALLDAEDGTFTIDPPKDVLKRAETTHTTQTTPYLERFKNKSSQTKDNHRFTIMANVADSASLPDVQANGAEGIGLVRTEFMFMRQEHVPSYEKQTQWMKRFFKAHDDCTIRTIDFGDDKPFLPLTTVSGRGLALALKHPDLFKTHIKALLAASVNAKAPKLLLPMVENETMFLNALKLIEACKKSMSAQSIPFSQALKIGAMIETKAGVEHSEAIAKHAAFFAIGTNDLMRSNGLTKAHPALYKLINTVVRVAKHYNLTVRVCGDIATDIDIAGVLIGLGIDELSMPAQTIPTIRSSIATKSFSELSTRAKHILKSEDEAEVTTALHAKA